MSNELTQKVNQEIYKKFPNMAGVNPKITWQPGDKILFIYKSSGELPGGKTLSQVIRVVVNSNGEVCQITSSRG